jgi:ribosomal protein S18 acetylase RimI-like enzyme
MKKFILLLSASFSLHAVQIVPIQESEVPQVYSQLQELVLYEGTAPYFKLTEERMRQELFAPSATWNCLVGKEGDEVVAFCFYTIANTNRAFNLTPLLYIDDLFVKEKYRRQNIGQNLLHELSIIAKSLGITRIEVYCMKDNEIGQAFYRKAKGHLIDIADLYKFDVDQLTKKPMR